MIDLECHGCTAAMPSRSYKRAAAFISYENIVTYRGGYVPAGFYTGRVLALSLALKPPVSSCSALLLSPFCSFHRIFSLYHEVHRQLEELLEGRIRGQPVPG